MPVTLNSTDPYKVAARRSLELHAKLSLRTLFAETDFFPTLELASAL